MMMANAIAFFIALSKLAIITIILWFVCELLPMTPPWRKIVQWLIVMIALLAALGDAVGGAQLAMRRTDPSFSMDRVPNIMTPERR